MIPLYEARDSPLHRLPAWGKLLGLVVLALALSFMGTWWPGLAGVWVLVIAGYVVAQLGLQHLVGQVLAVRFVVVIMVASQLLFLPIPDALANTLRVLAVLLLAALVTLTTRMSDLLEALQRALAPLAHLGVPTAQISLTIALTLSTVPVIAAYAGQLRDAQLARTGRVRLVALVVPLLVVSLKHADELADALRARGLDERGPSGVSARG